MHYFPNGFLAAADVNITSSLDFRGIFSDSIQQAISPEERSQVFVNKNSGDYSLNFIARTQVVSIPSVRVRTRALPGVSLDKRPSQLPFFEKLPLYFSFEGSVEGVSRKETVTDLIAFNAEGNANPIITPSIVQRLDFHPKFSVPFDLPGGWGVTATAKLRGTFYSNSLEPPTRLVLARDVVRGYGEFELDVRPPALARNFRRGEENEFWFRHVIEPYFIYRKIGGISNFERIIRFDSTDAVADTNEFEFGLTNRFFTRRSTENVTGRVSRYGRGGGLGGTRGEEERDEREERRREDERRRDEEQQQPPEGEARQTSAAGGDVRQPLARQPYEFLSITLRQKYFFDRTFGGALVAGRRNQFYPINTFSGFTYGGVPRRFSPLFVEARVREPEKRDRGLYADVRMNLDVLGEGGGLRDLAVGGGVIRRVPKLRALEVFQTFYYTRAVTLAPSLRQFSNAARQRAGHAARLAVESRLLPRRPRARIVRRRLVLLRLPEPPRQRQLLARQLGRHPRLHLGLLRRHRAELHLQHRPARREPRRLQLPPQRHRHLRHRTDRPALPVTVVSGQWSVASEGGGRWPVVRENKLPALATDLRPPASASCLLLTTDH